MPEKAARAWRTSGRKSTSQRAGLMVVTAAMAPSLVEITNRFYWLKTFDNLKFKCLILNYAHQVFAINIIIHYRCILNTSDIPKAISGLSNLGTYPALIKPRK